MIESLALRLKIISPQSPPGPWNKGLSPPSRGLPTTLFDGSVFIVISPPLKRRRVGNLKINAHFTVGEFYRVTPQYRVLLLILYKGKD